MRIMECIEFRSCRPTGRTLAAHLVDLFSEEARSHEIKMTFWLDDELPGDLRVHLESKRRDDVNAPLGHLGMQIEQVLESQGLVSRRRLISLSETE